MPYIDPEARNAIAAGDSPRTAGELNYVITRLILEYLEMKGRSYSTMNEIIGVLESCKLEFYRRVALPYEQKACYNAGDVYEEPNDNLLAVWWREAQGQGPEVLRQLPGTGCDLAEAEKS